MLSEEGRDFLFNKLLNPDPKNRLDIHAASDYLRLPQSHPKVNVSFEHLLRNLVILVYRSILS